MEKVFSSSKPYLIAETAYTFEGDKEYLLKQVEEIKFKQVDALKFHMIFNKEEYATKNYKIINEYLEKWIMPKETWVEILMKTKENLMDTVILVDDTESIRFCRENSNLVDAIEVHAACVNDIKILDEALKFSKDFDKTFVIGISGFEIQELSSIVEYIKTYNLEKVLLMYGFQNFPTRLEDINLSKIPFLEKAFGYKVGYADHTKFDDENKENLIYSAYTLGANVQEIHYVLEEGIERIDYVTGLSSGKLEKIKNNLEKICLSLGVIDFRLNEGEKKYLNFRKIPVYSKNMKKGEILKENNINFKRTEKPSRQNKFREIEIYYGKTLKNDVFYDDEIIIGDLDE